MKRTRWFVVLPLGLLAVACQPTQEAPEPASPPEPALPPEPVAATAQWECSNDLEISCDAEGCAVSESVTPMSVTMDDAGGMSVCAYTGCWEGTGTVTQSERFVVLASDALPFSTAPDTAAIAIVLDKADRVAVLKAKSFAHPLRCEQGQP